MKIIFACVIALLLIITSPLAMPVKAQTQPVTNDTMQFDSEAELRKMIPANTPNLRKSFYLIINAHTKKMAQIAALQYRELWKKKPNDPVLKAEYAFCYATAIASFPYEKPTAQQKSLKTKLLTYYREVSACREEALKALPQSPEVLIMTAIGDDDSWKPKSKSIALTEKAINLDPNWSYAHYWLGHSFVNHAGPYKSPRQQEYLLKALSELKTVQTLDPSVKNGNILFNYIHIYNGLGQYEKAIEYINRRLEVNAQTNGTDLERDALLQWKKTAQAKLKP